MLGAIFKRRGSADNEVPEEVDLLAIESDDAEASLKEAATDVVTEPEKEIDIPEGSAKATTAPEPVAETEPEEEIDAPENSAEATTAPEPAEEAKAPSPAGGDQETSAEGDNSLSDLFAGTSQEEENGLAAILELVPEVSMEELLSNLEEIKEMLRGRLEEQQDQ